MSENFQLGKYKVWMISVLALFVVISLLGFSFTTKKSETELQATQKIETQKSETSNSETKLTALQQKEPAELTATKIVEPPQSNTEQIVVAQATSSRTIRQGVDYEIVNNPLPPEPNRDENKVDVHQFFSISCPHCQRFAPVIDEWVKKNKRKINYSQTQYVAEGSGLGDPIYGQIYYSFEAMGIVDKMLIPAFTAVLNQRLNFKDDKVLNDWLKQHNVDVEKFAETRKSFGVNSAVNLAKQRILSAEVFSTPQVIVGGKYRIINARSLEDILNVADLLVSKVKFEQKK